MLMKGGGASSSPWRLGADEAGDSLDWLIDLSADIVYRWLGQCSSLQVKAAERACMWVTWWRSVGYRRWGSWCGRWCGTKMVNLWVM